MSLRQQKFSFLSHRLISLVKALYWKLLPECTKMRIFRCNFAKFSRGHAPGPPIMAVPSALPLKLICDVTRLWRNLAAPRKFSAYGTACLHYGCTPRSKIATRKPIVTKCDAKPQYHMRFCTTFLVIRTFSIRESIYGFDKHFAWAVVAH